ncbi:MAG: F0F1 ATP synthase subunit B [Myxococcaceae bacterium]|nr:F0F1 ATP synthase subunit B [Myxococcaceae bacterium]MCI0671160.1 F0F1 ATP synthase subunit B [Myxococcaceae bacterium]
MSMPLVLASGFTDVRPGLIFWTLVTFILVFAVLRWKAWGPILALADERERQITGAIEAAKRERAEAEKLLLEQKMAIADARREAAELVRKNQAEMEHFRDEMKASAQREVEALKESARRDITEQQKKAVAELKALSVDMAIDIAQKLLGEKMDDSRHRALAQQFVREVPAEDASKTPRA